VTVKGETTDDDSAANVRRNADAFKSYVNLGEGAIFSKHATAIYGLHSSHPSIVYTDEIHTVWDQFCRWLRANVAPDELMVLVAWNGATCDLKWLWKMSQTPRSQLNLLGAIKYFINPLRVIQNYKGCKLHPTKSKLDSLELVCVWKDINAGRNLNGAYDSLIDVKTHSNVLVHPSFVPYTDQKASIQPISWLQ